MAEHITPEQIADQLRQLRVADLLVAETTTLAQVAYAKLGEREVDQARLAIDAMRALVPVLAGAIPEQAQRDLQQVVANLQLAFASVASHPKEEAKAEGGASPPSEAAPQAPPEEERGEPQGADG